MNREGEAPAEPRAASSPKHRTCSDQLGRSLALPVMVAASMFVALNFAHAQFRGRRANAPPIVGRRTTNSIGNVRPPIIEPAAAAPPIVSVQEPSADDRPGRWALETLELKDGGKYVGLVQAAGDAEYDFAEIVQPPGRAMHAVIRGVPTARVARVVRLPDEQHAELVERFAQFRNRAVIEAGQIDSVELAPKIADDVDYLLYRGDWFDLWSTADDESTRRSVVRLEQMFRAYRTLLPPRVEPTARLRIYLYGSVAEYRQRLQTLGLQIENAAFYSPRQEMIVAGSELSSFSRALKLERQRAEGLKAQLAKLEAEFAGGLTSLSGELRKSGFTVAEVTAELNQRKSQWRRETKDLLEAIAVAQRHNDAKFADVARQMFTRLNHEAFHAYLDHYVFPHNKQHVPRWLNEGLAQIFESGQLDGDRLRIDAAPADKLAALERDRGSQPPFSLAELLIEADRPFLTPHRDAAAQGDERLYLYAWALAWRLAFEENLLTPSKLEQYVASDDQSLAPIERFELLVGQPLPEFEKQWRVAIAAANK